jgi:hypothetical protein
LTLSRHLRLSNTISLFEGNNPRGHLIDAHEAKNVGNLAIWLSTIAAYRERSTRQLRVLRHFGINVSRERVRLINCIFVSRGTFF